MYEGMMMYNDTNQHTPNKLPYDFGGNRMRTQHLRFDQITLGRLFVSISISQLLFDGSKGCSVILCFGSHYISGVDLLAPPTGNLQTGARACTCTCVLFKQQYNETFLVPHLPQLLSATTSSHPLPFLKWKIEKLHQQRGNRGSTNECLIKILACHSTGFKKKGTHRFGIESPFPIGYFSIFLKILLVSCCHFTIQFMKPRKQSTNQVGDYLPMSSNTVGYSSFTYE